MDVVYLHNTDDILTCCGANFIASIPDKDGQPITIWPAKILREPEVCRMKGLQVAAVSNLLADRGLHQGKGMLVSELLTHLKEVFLYCPECIYEMAWREFLAVFCPDWNEPATTLRVDIDGAVYACHVRPLGLIAAKRIAARVWSNRAPVVTDQYVSRLVVVQLPDQKPYLTTAYHYYRPFVPFAHPELIDEKGKLSFEYRDEANDRRYVLDNTGLWSYQINRTGCFPFQEQPGQPIERMEDLPEHLCLISERTCAKTDIIYHGPLWPIYEAAMAEGSLGNLHNRYASYAFAREQFMEQEKKRALAMTAVLDSGTVTYPN